MTITAEFLDNSVRSLPGVGTQRAKSLEKMGLRTIRDLFFLFPRRYEDRSSFKKIKDVVPGETVSVRGEISSIQSRYFRGRGHLQMSIKDETGLVQCIWFNQGYLKKSFTKGEELIVFGKASKSTRLSFQNPEYEKCNLEQEELESVHMGRITPVYPLVSGLFQKSLRQHLWKLVHQHLAEFDEHLPDEICERYGFISFSEALKQIHFPESTKHLEEGRQRLIFDDFFLFQLQLLERRKKFQEQETQYPFPNIEEVLAEFKIKLPFQLTLAQEKVLQEFVNDLKGCVPSMRLLQGDVGSGKTVVAAGIMAAASRQGYQSALLAPTETLAEQHFKTLQALMQYDPAIKLELLTGSQSSDVKQRVSASLEAGENIIVVGTHALLQESINFKNLALVVFDEQHKFGVEQRSKLFNLAPRPHVLLMTATPIPRTLAMTLYGDMGYSVLDELPKGRRPIQTAWIQTKDKLKTYQEIEERLSAGEQGYFVYPAIEETDKSKRASCESDFPKIQKYYPNHTINLVHGRMKSEERQQIMKQFIEGEAKALVATTVIEVGIDNPNATFVLIQGAEFYGLSQLHQIRGRVGRGSQPSVCYLVGEAKTDEAQQRFEVMTQTTDGFRIAEEDLKLRGPGDFLGTRQSGLPLFRIANLVTDREMLELARKEAGDILTLTTKLGAEEKKRLQEEVERFQEELLRI